ncbi:hypothetical protein NVP1210O_38 [Vibrio phage 1.210.O._10N.222.52.C2]|nr:hypothetical protein NVP1210O_38 [Vibrio phage 1.210.O._10N.222.52.C2]
MYTPIGVSFGKLTVISEATKEERKSRHRKMNCICDCGNKTMTMLFTLKNGQAKSCGCVAANKAKERWINPTDEMITQANEQGVKNSTHGMSRHPAFSQWADMKSRCINKSHAWYESYGGRGIELCERWLSFDMFWLDMGSDWSKGMQIDRVDNDAGYSKENCKWSTRSQQQRNKSNTFYIDTPDGVMDITTAGEKYNLNPSCLRYRYEQGMRGKDLIKKSIRG